MCTRVLWNTNALAVVVGRSMDWPQTTEPTLTAFARGRPRDGGRLGPTVVVPDNPARWESRYASVATTVYGIGTADGMNEQGLAAHLLYLRSTELPERDASVPGLSIAQWAQYVLDLASSVEEALRLLEAVQLVMVDARGFGATVHLALEDATGDSAIVEYSGGTPVVHHGREFTLMTNDPPYDEQLEALARLDYSHPSKDLPVPGNVSALDRFQRAAYFSALLPEPATDRAAVAAVGAIMRNVSVPFGAPYGDFGVYNTEYRTVCDLTNLCYYFELTTSPHAMWTDLSAVDHASDGGALTVDPDSLSMSGDVTGRYAPAEVAF